MKFSEWWVRLQVSILFRNWLLRAGARSLIGTLVRLRLVSLVAEYKSKHGCRAKAQLGM